MAKNKKTILLLLTVAAIAMIGLYIFTARPKKSPAYYPKAPDTAQKANVRATTPPPPQVAASNLPVSTAVQSSPDKTTTITSPHPGGTVTSGSHITGTSQAGAIYYRLKTAQNGQVAGTGPIAVSSGSFSFDLLFQREIKGGTDMGTLEIYTQDANGVAQSIASVNVVVQG